MFNNYDTYNEITHFGGWSNGSWLLEFSFDVIYTSLNLTLPCI